MMGGSSAKQPPTTTGTTPPTPPSTPSKLKTAHLLTWKTWNPLTHLHLSLSHPLWTLLEQHIYALPNPPPPRKRIRPMQVLCVGLPRTGTESLQQALLRLGYDHTYHGWDIVFNEACYAPGWVRLARRKWFPTCTGGPPGDSHSRDPKGPVTAAEFDEVLGHSVAVTDVAGAFAADMIAAYPEAKVVLNLRRDLDAWERSLRGSLVRSGESWAFWAASWLGRECFWAWHFYNRVTTPLLFRAADGDLKRAIVGNARWVEREHASMVRGLVPKDRLLEWCVEDGWAPLCEFLDKPVPDGEFPHANTTNGGWDARAKQLKKRWVRRAFQTMRLLGMAAGLVVSIAVACMWMYLF